jgi:DNA-binding LytR/AlgR family response regulator
LAYTAIIADGFVLKQFDINYSDKLQRERLHIAVVEDEVIIATNIVRKLNLLGYEAYPPCASFKEAAALFAAEKPDAALIDIRIKGQRDGIELAEYIRENYDVPIIFATANGDEATIQRAKNARPNAYVLKPFTKQDLHAAIEVAMLNFEMMPKVAKPVQSNSLIVKVSHDLVKLACDDILYLRSEGNYVKMVMRSTKARSFRTTLSTLETQLDPAIFFRIGKSCIVNFNYVDELEFDQIKIGNEFLATSKVYRSYEEMLEAFKKHS